MGERNLYGQGLNWTVVFRHLTTILCRKSVPIMWKIVYSKFNFTCYSPNHLCPAYLIITNSTFLLLWLIFCFFFLTGKIRVYTNSPGYSRTYEYRLKARCRKFVGGKRNQFLLLHLSSRTTELWWSTWRYLCGICFLLYKYICLEFAKTWLKKFQVHFISLISESNGKQLKVTSWQLYCWQQTVNFSLRSNRILG